MRVSQHDAAELKLSSNSGTKPLTEGESAAARRAITAPCVLTAPETKAAEVRLDWEADPSRLFMRGGYDYGAEL